MKEHGASPKEQGASPVAGRPILGVPLWCWALALVSATLTLIANVNGIASGDDGVGYRAIADSILGGNGLRYFLEDPLTVWPPLWPALMAAIARLTPLNAVGGSIVLNAITAFVAVPVGYRLLKRTVGDHRLVLLGVLVIGLGSATVGFGHLLMTDFAFAVVVMMWILALINFYESQRFVWLVAAASLTWLGFGLRYVAVYLIGLGGLWLLLDFRRRFTQRLASGIAFGLMSIVVPVIWMLRNHSLDGTYTGPRYPSARGPIDNGFDILVALGKWILPGVADDFKYIWAAIGAMVLLAAVLAGWMVLGAAGRSRSIRDRLTELFHWLGRPSGLLAVQAFGYLAYMLYVRSTTALNPLDLRLLNPAYLSLVALALVLVDRLRLLGPQDPWRGRAMIVAYAWAAANVTMGLVSVISFAGGDIFFDGNYEAPVFRDVRADAILEVLPEDCELYSNLPNALYPALESEWSPRRTGLESNEEVDDLDLLIESVEDGAEACIIWVDERPDYGHLWQLEQLKADLDLENLGESANVKVFRVRV